MSLTDIEAKAAINYLYNNIVTVTDTSTCFSDSTTKINYASPPSLTINEWLELAPKTISDDTIKYIKNKYSEYFI